MTHFDLLLSRAHTVVDGRELNAVLSKQRDELARHHSTVFAYELVLDQGGDWSAFVSNLVPKLTEHLRVKGLGLTGGPGVLLTLWCEDRAHILDCASFFEALREIEALPKDALKSMTPEEFFKGLEEAPPPAGPAAGPGDLPPEDDEEDDDEDGGGEKR